MKKKSIVHSPRQKVLFVSPREEYTHKRFSKLEDELHGIADVCFVEHGRDVTDADLSSLGYRRIASGILPGSNHHLLLYYYHHYPDYDYYWNIEYDVLFTGHWKTLFEAAGQTDEDLITNHITPRSADNAFWLWWKYSNHPGTWKSFNPIYRLSNRACEFLDKQFKSGRSGHHEVEIPSCLIDGGFSYSSFQKLGFVPSPRESSHYTPYLPDSTFEYRLNFNSFDKKDTLYHPVKYETEYS